MSMTIAVAKQTRFREALASFASGVTIVTFRDELDRPCGMTASSFSSVSIDPLLVLVCLNRSARTYDDVLARGRFGINILSSDCVEISDLCARPGEDKLLRDGWLEDPVDGRSPVLRDSLAYLDCEVHTEVGAGTHSIIVGRVLAIGVSDTHEDNPLLYYRGSYRELAATESVNV